MQITVAAVDRNDQTTRFPRKHFLEITLRMWRNRT